MFTICSRVYFSGLAISISLNNERSTWHTQYSCFAKLSFSFSFPLWWRTMIYNGERQRYCWTLYLLTGRAAIYIRYFPSFKGKVYWIISCLWDLSHWWVGLSDSPSQTREFSLTFFSIISTLVQVCLILNKYTCHKVQILFICMIKQIKLAKVIWALVCGWPAVSCTLQWRLALALYVQTDLEKTNLLELWKVPLSAILSSRTRLLATKKRLFPYQTSIRHDWFIQK